MDDKKFLKNQLYKTFKNSSAKEVLLENMTYVIIPCSEKNEAPKNNLDEIINRWVLPAKSDIKLSLDQVIETLASYNGKFPLWVNVKQQNEDFIFLKISKRFRKIKAIKEFHKNNEILPFILDNSIDYKFTDEIQKIGLTRKLLWNIGLTDQEKQFFEKYSLTFDDIRNFAVNHFKSYNYYPPNTNQYNSNKKNYNKLVIKRNFDYSIIENIGTTNEKVIMSNKDLDLILRTYLDLEMNFKIDEIIIEK